MWLAYDDHVTMQVEQEVFDEEEEDEDDDEEDVDFDEDDEGKPLQIQANYLVSFINWLIVGEGDDDETTELPPAAEEEPTEISKNQ